MPDGGPLQLNLRDILTSEFATATFPLYWSSITAQDNLTVMVMEYAGHTSSE